MVSGLKNEKLKGRNFALTIILGVFIAVMVCVLFNLIVSYVYEPPNYDNYCKGVYNTPYPVKYGGMGVEGVNCTFSPSLQAQSDECSSNRGVPVFNYDEKGCTVSLKECSMCGKEFDDGIKKYNRQTFFIFAVIGFILIAIGLFVSPLLLQISTLPAGAFLVIEAAVKNFDDKLTVIIVFALLIVAAIVLALRKLK